MFYRYKRRTEVLVRTTTNVKRIRQNETMIKLNMTKMIMTKLTKTKLKFRRGTIPVRTILRFAKMCWMALVMLMVYEFVTIKMCRYFSSDELFVLKILVYILLIGKYFRYFVAQKETVKKGAKKILDTAIDKFKATIDYDKNAYDKILNKTHGVKGDDIYYRKILMIKNGNLKTNRIKFKIKDKIYTIALLTYLIQSQYAGIRVQLLQYLAKANINSCTKINQRVDSQQLEILICCSHFLTWTSGFSTFLGFSSSWKQFVSIGQLVVRRGDVGVPALAATSFNERGRDITSDGWYTDRLAADPEQQGNELKIQFCSVFEERENIIINAYHWFLFLFLFIIKEWNEDKTSKVCLKMDMKAAMVLMISVHDIIMRRCGVIEVNYVDQVIYLNRRMRMRNRLKLQEIYIQDIRRRFAFLLNQIEKLKIFSTFNLEHKSSCSTKVHISNVLFYRYVAANYLAVSKTMEQESSHQARGWVYCD